MVRPVLLVIGAGGIGLAIARRLGSDKTVLLADANELTLDTSCAALEDEGHAVQRVVIDVSDRRAVERLAESAGKLGPVRQIAHTAGLSPAQASAEAIIRVDLLGVALVLEVFGLLVDSGGTGVVISSMAAHLADNLAPDQERKLALTPTDELLELPFVDPNRIQDPGTAYVIAKRANQLRVQAASIEWGARGARINSISPGIVSTSMGRQELSSESGPLMRGLIDGSAAHRVGTPGDIASAAAFLLGADSAFITGTDLLVDGGVVAAFRSLGTGGS